MFKIVSVKWNSCGINATDFHLLKQFISYKTKVIKGWFLSAAISAPENLLGQL